MKHPQTASSASQVNSSDTAQSRSTGSSVVKSTFERNGQPTGKKTGKRNEAGQVNTGIEKPKPTSNAKASPTSNLPHLNEWIT